MTISEMNEAFPEYRNLLGLNQSQTAKIIGVSIGSLSNWRKDGLGPEYLKIEQGKGRIIYPKKAVLEWLSKTIKTA